MNFVVFFFIFFPGSTSRPSPLPSCLEIFALWMGWLFKINLLWSKDM